MAGLPHEPVILPHVSISHTTGANRPPNEQSFLKPFGGILCRAIYWQRFNVMAIRAARVDAAL
jgi:hypothetical protein